MLAGRRTPDRLPQLIAAHREALLTHRRRRHAVLVGKSMGSRVGCHLSLEEPVEALVCLGYPLRGIGGQVRDEVLLALATPILFVQGTRDTLCPLPLLAEVRKRMKAPNELLVVEGGDHSLVLSAAQRRAEGITQEQSDERVLAAIARFLDERV
jgi:predicted alpha/beta-hydrolase family hydrolase